LAKIAILPTSKPLRVLVVKRGKTKQVLNGKMIGELSSNYDLVIIGSTASDEFYEYVYNYLPLNQRVKFRLYGRSFFTSQREVDDSEGPVDQRSAGWMAILKENRINYESMRKTMGPDLLPRIEQFTWQNMAAFILDDRVEVLSGEEQMLH
jgi:hypothetical protein